jgi:hypothetical protein
LLCQRHNSDFFHTTCAFDATPAVLFPHVWSLMLSRKFYLAHLA